MMKEVRHVGIVVEDMEAMLGFYRDLLGMTVAVDFSEQGEFIDTVIGMRGIDLRMVKLTAEDGGMIELLQYRSLPDVGNGTEKLYQRGLTHIAFTVDSVDAIYNDWRSRNVPFLSPPTRSPDGKARLAFCRDPEGNFLEIVEVLP